MQTVDRLTVEAVMVVDKLLTPTETEPTTPYAAMMMSLGRHAKVLGILEQVLYDAFKQLPVDYVEKVVDKMKKL